MKFLLSAIFTLFFSTYALHAQERPFIWVQKQDREHILDSKPSIVMELLS